MSRKTITTVAVSIVATFGAEWALFAQPDAPQIVYTVLSTPADHPARAALSEVFDPTASDSMIDTAVGNLFADHQTFGISSSELFPQNKFSLGAQRILNYQLTKDGIELHQGFVQIVFDEATGRLLQILTPRIEGRDFAPSQPELTEKEAVARALEVSAISQPEVIDSSTLRYVATARNGYRLAWNVVIASGDKGARLDDLGVGLWIDAQTGAVLQRVSLVARFEAQGEVNAWGTSLTSNFPDMPGNEPVGPVPVPRLLVEILWPSYQTGVTDSNGNFSISTSAETVLIQAELREGPDFTLVDEGGEGCADCAQKDCVNCECAQGVLVSDSYIFKPVETEFIFNLNEEAENDPEGYAHWTAQVNAWQYLSRLRQYVEAVEDRNNIDQPYPPLTVFVNKEICAHDFGLAYYVDTSIVPNPRITCFASTNVTYNVAYSSPLHHEYGHYLVRQLTGRKWDQNNRNHHETVADLLSVFYVDDPLVAQRLFIPDPSYFRRNLEDGTAMDEERNEQGVWQTTLVTGLGVWPVPSAIVNIDSLHYTGMPLSNAWWDLRKMLMGNYVNGDEIAEDLLFRYVYKRRDTGLPQPDVEVVDELLIVDDDPYFGGDNDPANGTPHDSEIQDAFAEHNLYLKPFIRGDANQDGNVTSHDEALIGKYLDGNAELLCLDAADADDDGDVDNNDRLYILDYYFGGQAAPPPPFPECGTDPTYDDTLECAYVTECPY